MATQPLPVSEQLSHATAIPPVHRLLVSRRPPRPASGHRTMTRKQTGPEDVKQRLMVELIPLVKRIAFKMREHLPSHVDVDDLIGNGMLGLVDAVAKFDAGKQVKLASYARHRVRGGILDGLRSIDPASRDLRRKNKRIQNLYGDLEAKLGRGVTDEEIARALGLSLAKWHNALHEIQSVGLNLGERLISAGPTSKRPPMDAALLARDDADPFDLCYRREQQEILSRALSHLRERDRQIMTLYYQQDLTMKQIAEQLNLDESRISQLHSAALARLKASINSILHPQPANKLPTPAPLPKALGAGA